MRLKLTCKSCRRNIEIEGDTIPLRMDCPNCSAKLEIPRNILSVDQMIAGFRIVKHLGSGSMGCVYEALQVSMNRPIALKVLHPELTRDEKEVSDFFHEIRTLGRLDHPNIVTAFDSSQDEGQIYLAMMLIEGRTWEEVIEHEGPLPEAEVLKVGRKVAEALEYAWNEHKILHRDIKPSNIMLHGDVDPKLLDVGICMVHGRDRETTNEGMIVGTPYYMSPEQSMAKQGIDFRTDIYALGCTMYHAATGKLPYDGDNIADIINGHRHDPVPTASQVCEDVSPALSALLKRMMAKKPEDRHESWRDTLIDIRRVIKGRMPKGLEDEDPATQPQKSHAIPVRKMNARGVQKLSERRRQSKKKQPISVSTMATIIIVLFLLTAGILMLIRCLPYGRSGPPPPKGIDKLAPKKKDDKQGPANKGENTDHPPTAKSTPLPDMGTDSHTIMLWFRTPRDGVLFSQSPKGKWTKQTKAILVRDGKLMYAITGSGVVQGNTKVNDEKWHHLAVVGPFPQLIFIDGRQELIGELDVGPGPDDQQFRLGPLRAEFDEVRFFSRRLTMAEIRSCYDNPASLPNAPLAGRWPLDGNRKDVSRGGNYFVRKGGAQYVRGRHAGAIRLEKGTRLTALPKKAE